MLYLIVGCADNADETVKAQTNYSLYKMANLNVWHSKLMARVEAGGPVGDCLVWTGATSSRGYGMMRVRWTDGQSRVMGVHQLGMMCALQSTQFPYGYNVSHLCHNKLCITVGHLSLEPNWANSQRASCLREGTCFGHAGFKRCIL